MGKTMMLILFVLENLKIWERHSMEVLARMVFKKYQVSRSTLGKIGGCLRQGAPLKY